MKLGSTQFLRFAVICIGIPILALCVLVLPKIAIEAMGHTQNGATLAYVVFGILLILYLSAIPFYIALYQAWKLLRYIDLDQAFSEISVITLKKIRTCAITITGLFVLALPLIYIIAEWDDAPGLILIGLVMTFAAMVVAVFSALLKKLLQEAIEIKSENDLTV